MSAVDEALRDIMHATGPDRQGPVTSVALGGRIKALVDALAGEDPVEFGAQSRAIRELLDRGAESLMAERDSTRDEFLAVLKARETALKVLHGSIARTGRKA